MRRSSTRHELENRLTAGRYVVRYHVLADNFRFAAMLIAIAMTLNAAEGKMRFLPGAEPMRDEILRFVPISTRVDAARHTMEQNGFTCERKTNADFMATDQITRKSKFLEKKNYR